MNTYEKNEEIMMDQNLVDAELNETSLDDVNGGCMGAVLIGWGGIILYLGASNMKKKYRR